MSKERATKRLSTESAILEEAEQFLGGEEEGKEPITPGGVATSLPIQTAA